MAADEGKPLQTGLRFSCKRLLLWTIIFGIWLLPLRILRLYPPTLLCYYCSLSAVGLYVQVRLALSKTNGRRIYGQFARGLVILGVLLLPLRMSATHGGVGRLLVDRLNEDLGIYTVSVSYSEFLTFRASGIVKEESDAERIRALIRRYWWFGVEVSVHTRLFEPPVAIAESTESTSKALKEESPQ